MTYTPSYYITTKLDGIFHILLSYMITMTLHSQINNTLKVFYESIWGVTAIIERLLSGQQGEKISGSC